MPRYVSGGIDVSPTLTVSLQYRWLSKDYPYAGRLRLAYRIKGAIALILILLSIAFGVALFKAEDVGGRFLDTISFPSEADGFPMFNSDFGMGHRLWVHVLLTFLLLGPSIIEAGKIRQR